MRGSLQGDEPVSWNSLSRHSRLSDRVFLETLIGSGRFLFRKCGGGQSARFAEDFWCVGHTGAFAAEEARLPDEFEQFIRVLFNLAS